MIKLSVARFFCEALLGKEIVVEPYLNDKYYGIPMSGRINYLDQDVDSFYLLELSNSPYRLSARIDGFDTFTRLGKWVFCKSLFLDVSEIYITDFLITGYKVTRKKNNPRFGEIKP